MATMTVAQARTAIAVSQNDTALAVTIRPGFETAASFELLQREAKMFNASSLVPKHFQGPQNFSNTVIALEIAGRIGASPLQVMQELYVVHERPAFSAKFLIATFNRSGRFSSIRYEFSGTEGRDDWGCRAVATELASGTELVGTTVTIAMAKAEGWFNKQGSKWQSMPGQMLRYRAAAWFIRAYAPEISMGIRSVEEERDGGAAIDYEEVVTVAAAAAANAAEGRESEIAGNGPEIDSEARSALPPSPTQEKPKRARRTAQRAAMRPLDIEPAPAAAKAPAEAAASRTETVEAAPAAPSFEEQEERFLAMCDKAGFAVGEALEMYDVIYGETETEVAVPRMVSSPDVWAAVRDGLANLANLAGNA